VSAPVGLDTNILARYYVADDVDAQGQRQREQARRLFESGQPLAVCKTVLLELEWVLRGYYGFERAEVARVYAHLLAQPHIHVEDGAAVRKAVESHGLGLDFADALHHASYAHCAMIASFDDRGFARKTERLKLQPKVSVPRG
jgi:predicted nucleic-acid-binding protein